MSEQVTDRLSPWWKNSVIIIMIAGFSILLYVAVQSYHNAPPIPDKVVDPQGNILFTSANIKAGQEVFLKYGLMEHGTLMGHGAYIGPDYTAEYLHNNTLSLQDLIANKRYKLTFKKLTEDQKTSITSDVQSMLHQNKYDASTGTLTYTAAEAAAFQTEVQQWTNFFTKPDQAAGLPQNFISDPSELKDLTTFFS